MRPCLRTWLSKRKKLALDRKSAVETAGLVLAQDGDDLLLAEPCMAEPCMLLDRIVADSRASPSKEAAPQGVRPFLSFSYL
jgi:hypothetical protein